MKLHCLSFGPDTYRQAGNRLRRAFLQVGFAVSVLTLQLGTSVPVNAQPDEWIYTVVPGDNLWNFSARHLDSVLRFDDLRRLNNIPEPRKMRPGTSIRVPMAWIPPAVPAPAEVIALTGTASLHRGAPTTGQAVVVGMRLRLGDRLRCDSGSSLALRFADGSILTLHENSELRLDLLTSHGDTGMVDSRLRLSNGRVDTRVKPAVGPGSRFEIHTPSAISAVRGTEYRAIVSDDETATIEVLEGSVAVEAQQQQQLVDAGFGTRVASGERPGAVRALLPPPVVYGPSASEAAQPVRFRWAPVAGAARYRLELSDDPGFTTIRWQTVVEETGFSLPRLPAGAYYFRLRGIDTAGFEGRSFTQELALDEPPPPRPIQVNLQRAGKGTLITWASDYPAWRFEVQVAVDADFRDAIDSEMLTVPELRLAGVTDGVRYLRIRCVEADGRAGPWSAVQTIDPLPERPSLLPYVVSGVWVLMLLIAL